MTLVLANADGDAERVLAELKLDAPDEELYWRFDSLSSLARCSRGWRARKPRLCRPDRAAPQEECWP